MKIAFIGSHGVGKTTLCYDLAARLKRLDLNVDMVKEVARECPLPINRETTLESQAWIIHSQIAEEIAVVLFIASVLLVLTVSFLCSLLESSTLSLHRSDVAALRQRSSEVGALWGGLKKHIEQPIAAILIPDLDAYRPVYQLRNVTALLPTRFGKEMVAADERRLVPGVLGNRLGRLSVQNLHTDFRVGHRAYVEADLS